jgi:hypothetical protein
MLLSTQNTTQTSEDFFKLKNCSSFAGMWQKIIFNVGIEQFFLWQIFIS